MIRWTAALLAMPLCLAAADDLPGAARELGRRTAAAFGSAPVAVTWRNLTSAAPDAVAQAKAAFEGAGVRIGESATEIHMTISENSCCGLLVENTVENVWISSWPRKSSSRSLPDATVEKHLIWEQDDPILDAATVPGDSLIVLTPAALLKTQPRQSVPIRSTKPWPRDMRGRLHITGDALQVDLPGMKCAGTWKPDLTLACSPSDQPWSLAAGRNYFVPPRKAPPYYAAAAVDQLWFLTLTDGTTGIFDTAFERIGSVPGWGSDIAATGLRCGGAPVILATRPGEGRDGIQAYAIVNRAPTPIGQPIEFNGPVTALWPGIAVVRNGKYQAYAISLACAP
jgi:hypothetical protein